MYLETHDVVKQYANHLALNKINIVVSGIAANMYMI